MTDRELKRTQFTKEYIAAQKRRRNKILALIFTGSVVIMTLFIWKNSSRYEDPDSGNYFFNNAPDYTEQQIAMTKVDLILEDGLAKIPLSIVRQHKLISTEYKDHIEKIYYGNLKVLPLTAYISSAGRLIVAAGICEPCYGTEFTLENKELVCQTCFTRWRNTDLFGVSGGCVRYPPEELKYTIKGEYIVLSQQDLSQWKPRIFSDEMANV
ncbi:MAG: Fe-S-containing protein [Peptococcaceae bacterium]